MGHTRTEGYFWADRLSTCRVGHQRTGQRGGASGTVSEESGGSGDSRGLTRRSVITVFLPKRRISLSSPGHEGEGGV